MSELYVWRSEPLGDIEPQHMLPHGGKMQLTPDYRPARPEDIPDAAIERMARAIAEGNGQDPEDWPHGFGESSYGAMARAAVQALLEESK